MGVWAPNRASDTAPARRCCDGCRSRDCRGRRAHEAFVGRAAELASFESALTGAAPCRVLFVHGAGGLGKTALLHQFRVRAREAGCAVVRVDGQDVDCSPEGLRAAVRSAHRVTKRGAADRPGWVLLIDCYERLAALDSWIRDSLIASLPADGIVVIAGREPPDAPWRTDPGWRSVVDCLPIGVLDAVDSEQLLAHAGVPEDRRRPLARIGRGHRRHRRLRGGHREFRTIFQRSVVGGWRSERIEGAGRRQRCDSTGAPPASTQTCSPTSSGKHPRCGPGWRPGHG